MMLCRIFVMVLAVLAIGFGGCGKSEPPVEEPVKTAEEFKAEADKEINAENLDAELDKLEEEIEADQ